MRALAVSLIRAVFPLDLRQNSRPGQYINDPGSGFLRWFGGFSRAGAPGQAFFRPDKNPVCLERGCHKLSIYPIQTPEPLLAARFRGWLPNRGNELFHSGWNHVNQLSH